jgi:hypothetical protein
MKIKVIQQYDSEFTLDPEAKAMLFQMLTSNAFLQQVCQQANCDRVQFTEIIFQPTPYTPEAKKGMPVEYEQYHSPDYVLINVPPNFMFNAKIFQPSRLCAIYQKL